MCAQFGSASADWSLFDSEDVTITRSVASETLPVTYSTLTLYDGPCDFQNRGGTIAFNPAGAVDATVGTIQIDPDAEGNLPTGILPGDVVALADGSYTVVNTTLWSMAPVHLEITIQRGNGPYTKA